MDAPATTPTVPACRTCGGRTIRWGKDRAGHPRHRCKVCKATFAVIPARPLGRMRLDLGKATLCLNLLVEGTSIRSTERIAGTHRDTIMRLLGVAGAKAEALLNRLVHKVQAKDIQADEIWAYVGMKEKTKVRIPLKATTCSGEDDHPSERSDEHRLMVGWGGRLGLLLLRFSESIGPRRRGCGSCA